MNLIQYQIQLHDLLMNIVNKKDPYSNSLRITLEQELRKIQNVLSKK